MDDDENDMDIDLGVWIRMPRSGSRDDRKLHDLKIGEEALLKSIFPFILSALVWKDQKALSVIEIEI